ncbi:MAG: EVE domain-containing protein [Planctomycetes bacterium]|nr:EVE domain-containing protein [Planctomycetota bacterium]
MPNRWILKSDPDTYGYEDLLRERETRWDGVRNNQALIHLRAMKAGDELLIYHSGEEKSVVGTARVKTGPYADPTEGDPKLVVVDLRVGKKLSRAVPLSELKARPEFADLGLVRISRLSVMPVSERQWKLLLEMARGG